MEFRVWGLVWGTCFDFSFAGFGFGAPEVERFAEVEACLLGRELGSLNMHLFVGAWLSAVAATWGV